MMQFKGIPCCGECLYYQKHKCTRFAKNEGTAQDHFYVDCPLPDVQPVKRGAWEHDKICSVCRHNIYDFVCGDVQSIEVHDMDYCPNCGAKMDGGNNDGKTD